MRRREAREHALALCYEIETRGMSAAQVLEGLPAPPDPYTEMLVRGVDEHRDEIDTLIRTYSEHWAVGRMPAIDRALLRIGTHELGYRPELPVAVVIDEAVELAGEYSTADSPRFVNALLARLAVELRGESGSGAQRQGKGDEAQRWPDGRERAAESTQEKGDEAQRWPDGRERAAESTQEKGST